MTLKPENVADAFNFEYFFSVATDLFCISGSDGYLKQVNSAWEEMLGLPKEFLYSKPLVSLFHPMDVERVLAEARQVRTGQKSLSFESRLRRADGKYVWILWRAVAGDDGTVYSVGRDITAKKRSEFELRFIQAQLKQVVAVEKEQHAVTVEQSARIRELFSQIPAIAAILRGPGHVFEFANHFCRELLGGRDPVGRTIQEVIGFVDPSISGFLDRAYLKGERVVAKEHVIHADWVANGEATDRYFNLVYEPIRNAQGETEGIWVLATDVTEEKSLKKRLESSERLASLGTLAAGVGHEINNPLTYVSGNLELLSMRLQDAPLAAADREKLQKLVSSSRRGVGKITEIVRTLRTFSRQDLREINTVIDLRSVIDSALQFAHLQTRPSARVRVQVEGEPKVLGSEGKLGQVLLNLLVNAAQAIGTGNVEKNEILVSVDSISDQRVKISVKDTGCGISAETLERIFDPFFTTKAVGEGTGLGLSISHAIITGMGGEIHVSSTVGSGSTFEIILPGYFGKKDIVKVANAPSKMRKVLIIDDEPSLVVSVRELLEETYEVSGTTRGSEALRWIVQGTVYDLILCDLAMPEMSGVDFFHEVSKLRAGVEERILFMTGGVSSSETMEFLTRNFKTPLEKPFDARQLRSAIQLGIDGTLRGSNSDAEPARDC